ncbi:hypothetical protein FRC17_009363 [Serendipita sp. 399]|nr:hypothetical protein FRC17_009363 [Serendipita sp. 399]
MLPEEARSLLTAAPPPPVQPKHLPAADPSLATEIMPAPPPTTVLFHPPNSHHKKPPTVLSYLPMVDPGSTYVNGLSLGLSDGGTLTPGGEQDEHRKKKRSRTDKPHPSMSHLPVSAADREGGGALVYCDSCPKSFHLLCLDPPIDGHSKKDEIPDGGWYCRECSAEHDFLTTGRMPSPPPQFGTELFSSLLVRLQSTNPSEFQLPEEIRQYYKNVARFVHASLMMVKVVTGPRGGYIDGRKWKLAKGNKQLLFEDRDLYKTRDRNNRPVLCYKCGGSAVRSAISGHARMASLVPPSPETILPDLPNSPITGNSSQPIDGVETTNLDILSAAATSRMTPEPVDGEMMNGVTLTETSTQQATKGKFTGKRKREPSPVNNSPDNNSQSGPRTRRRTENGGALKRNPTYDLSDGGRPILSCDFCPLHWHMDCLDPPMTAIPARERKWMCPNHIEHMFAIKPRIPRHSSEPVEIKRPGHHNSGLLNIVSNDPSPPPPPLRKRKHGVKMGRIEDMWVGAKRYRVPEAVVVLDFWRKIRDPKSSKLRRSNTGTSMDVDEGSDSSSSPLTELSSSDGEGKKSGLSDKDPITAPLPPPRKSRKSDRNGIKVNDESSKKKPRHSVSTAPARSQPRRSAATRKPEATADGEAKLASEEAGPAQEKQNPPTSAWERGVLTHRKAKEDAVLGHLRQPSIPKSQERLQFEAGIVEQSGFEDLSPSPIVEGLTRPKPGAFVELRRNATIVHGVLIGESAKGNLVKINALTQRGEIWSHNPDDILISIPNFAPLHLIHRIGLTDGQVSQEDALARLKIIKELNSFEEKITKMESHYKSTVAQVYQRITLENSTEWARVSVDEIVKSREISGDEMERKAAHVAVHKILMADPVQFVARQLHRSSLEFRTRPLVEIQNIHRVADWTRQQSPELTQFLEKVKKILEVSSRFKAQQVDGEPTQLNEQLPPFNDSDLHIIEFLRCAIRAHSAHQQSPYEVFAPTILKRLDFYKTDITGDVIFTFLQDIGILEPWHDQVQLVHESIFSEGRPKETKLVGISGLYESDRHADLRHDWGQLPVYVIDSADAHELDDGISIEKQQDGSTWIHVHIADPTSRLPRNHPIALTASQRGATIYAPQQALPMLPNEYAMTEHSLGALDGNGGQNVLSFSALVNIQGEILKTDIRVGVTRNIHVLTYSAVEKALGVEAPYIKWPFGEAPMDAGGKAVPDSSISDLRSLLEASRVLQDRRAALQRFTWRVPKARPIFPDKPVPTSTKIPQLWSGYPRLLYGVESGTLSPARRMVAEMMILAGQAAGRFCTERGLPALFRASPQPVGLDDQAKKVDIKLYGGELPLEIVLRNEFAGIPAYYHTNPSEHWVMGIPAEGGYVRVTSPLRRFSDMVMHWQIKSSLLNPKKAEISKQEMDDYAGRLYERERMISATDKSSNNYWASMFIQRRLKSHPDEPVLHGCDAYVSMTPEFDTYAREYITQVVLPDLGLRGWLSTPKTLEWELGTKLKVDIVDVTMVGKAKIRLQLSK